MIDSGRIFIRKKNLAQTNVTFVMRCHEIVWTSIKFATRDFLLAYPDGVLRLDVSRKHERRAIAAFRALKCIPSSHTSFLRRQQQTPIGKFYKGHATRGGERRGRQRSSTLRY